MKSMLKQQNEKQILGQRMGQDQDWMSSSERWRGLNKLYKPKKNKVCY